MTDELTWRNASRIASGLPPWTVQQWAAHDASRNGGHTSNGHRPPPDPDPGYDPYADNPPQQQGDGWPITTGGIVVPPGNASSNGAAPQPLRVLTRSALADLPKPAPLIADTLDLGTVVVPFGYTGTLKSFLALSWAATIATGTAFLDRPLRINPQRILYVAAEGLSGLDSRLLAWEAWHGAVIPDDRFLVLRDPVNLMDPRSVTELCAIVTDRHAFAVFIDTLAKVMVGADENSARDMGTAVAALYRIRDATGPTGIVVAPHHTGRDRTTNRGSSALESGVDCMYLAEGDDRLVKLSRTKRKDGPKFDQLDVSLELVPGTGSGVLTKITGSGQGPDRPSAAWILSGFVRMWSGDGISQAKFLDYALNVKGAPGRTQLYEGLNLLKDNGFIENVGTKSRPHLILTESGRRVADAQSSGLSGSPSGPVPEIRPDRGS